MITVTFTCKDCRKSWQRTFQSRKDIKKYLTLRDTCPVGYHIAEPSLIPYVTYRTKKVS